MMQGLPATVIRSNSDTRRIPIANDTMEAQWIDEGEKIPETVLQINPASAVKKAKRNCFFGKNVLKYNDKGWLHAFFGILAYRIRSL